jgi:FKBP-type peptidyl-prolyl cis-trans isomerase
MPFRPLVAVLCALSCATTAFAQEPAAVPAPAPAPVPAPAAAGAEWTLQQKASYLVGQQMADAIKRFDLDIASVQAGIGDAIAGKPSVIPPSEGDKVMGQYQQEFQGREAKKAAGRKDTNIAWLAENGKKPGIKTTASGLEYEVITAGAGKTPGANDKVSVNYRGTLIDGKEFDASAKHGGPAEFQVGGVIKGWTEALLLMKEGDKWRLYVPSELAYGENAPPSIGPNQVLIFEVELLKVMGAEGPKTLVPAPAK